MWLRQLQKNKVTTLRSAPISDHGIRDCDMGRIAAFSKHGTITGLVEKFSRPGEGGQLLTAEEPFQIGQRQGSGFHGVKPARDDGNGMGLVKIRNRNFNFESAYSHKAILSIAGYSGKHIDL